MYRKLMQKPPPPEIHHIYKVILLGDSGVGKSCLLTRWSQDYFDQTGMSTIGVDFKITYLETTNTYSKTQDFTTFQVNYWDTSGQERFRSIVTNYYRGINGAMLIFDLQNRDSFLGIQSWLQDCRKYGPYQVAFVLVGNKMDSNPEGSILSEAVSSKEAQEYAKELGIPYLETSAKTGEGVGEAFMQMVLEMEAIRKERVWDDWVQVQGRNNTGRVRLQRIRKRLKNLCFR